MNKENILSLYSIFESSTLDSRDEADLLFNKMLPDSSSNKVIFDFSAIDFISRSFADQFHKLNLKLSREKNIEVELANAGVPIIEMLRAVSNTQSKSTRESIKFPIYSFKDTTSLFEYLQSI